MHACDSISICLIEKNAPKSILYADPDLYIFKILVVYLLKALKAFTLISLKAFKLISNWIAI